MGELQKEYEGRIRFTIVPPGDTAELGRELEEYELGSHGLVGFSPDGEVVATLPGHSFERDQIVGVIEQLL